jgi:hypothetical protein
MDAIAHGFAAAQVVTVIIGVTLVLRLFRPRGKQK